MRSWSALIVPILLAAAPAAAHAATCANGNGFGASRTIEVETKDGPVYGVLTKLKAAPNLLGPKEVVLTFDDGPMPWITKSVLETLDRYCAKATFFSVGRMAAAYPATVKDVLARGHTLGTHTWSHPLNMPRMKREKAIDEIERGFAAVSAAAGQPIAPFFRFPGLSDSAGLVAHLKERGIATFTVDVVSNDSYIASPERLARETLAKIEGNRGGIVLFHDIKASTARALPQIMMELSTRGYRIVHLVAKAPMQPSAPLVAEVKPEIAAAEQQPKRLLPFYGAIAPRNVEPETAADDAKAAVRDSAEPAQEGGVEPAAKRTVKKTVRAPQPKPQSSSKAVVARQSSPTAARPAASIGESWATTIWVPAQKR